MLKRFIISTAEEEIDVLHIGDLKVEFLSLTLKLSKLIGPYLPNGENLNIRELKNGGSEKLLMG